MAGLTGDLFGASILGALPSLGTKCTLVLGVIMMVLALKVNWSSSAIPRNVRFVALLERELAPMYHRVDVNSSQILDEFVYQALIK